MRGRIVVACWVAFLAPAVWAGELVLYSITDQSVMYPAANRPVSVSVAEDKTDVFAVDPGTGAQRKLFSDVNAEIMLLPGGRTPQGIVAAGGRIFSVAVDRQARANGQHGTRTVYEISTDGSGKARKVFDIESAPNFRDLFVSPSGSKIGYRNTLGGKFYLFIRETATGKLLRKADIFSQTIYGDVSKIGWMADSERIFFSLAVNGDGDDAFWNTPDSPIGTYVMKDEDAVPTRLAPESELHFKTPGKEADIGEGASLIGVLPGGQYLFSDSTTPLYTLDLVTRTQKLIPANEIVGSVSSLGNSLHISPSGGELALMAMQSKSEKLPKLTASSTVSLWVLELQSGKQSKVLSFPPIDTTRGYNGPWINLIGWLGEQ